MFQVRRWSSTWTTSPTARSWCGWSGRWARRRRRWPRKPSPRRSGTTRPILGRVASGCASVRCPAKFPVPHWSSCPNTGVESTPSDRQKKTKKFDWLWTRPSYVFEGKILVGKDLRHWLRLYLIIFGARRSNPKFGVGKISPANRLSSKYRAGYSCQSHPQD